MNAKAKALGLRGTHFNPHGLDEPGNYSTARDVVRLLQAAGRVPFIRTWAGRSTATIAGGRQVETTDDLPSATCMGGKDRAWLTGWPRYRGAHGRRSDDSVAAPGRLSEEARNADSRCFDEGASPSTTCCSAIDARQLRARSRGGASRAWVFVAPGRSCGPQRRAYRWSSKSVALVVPRLARTRPAAGRGSASTTGSATSSLCQSVADLVRPRSRGCSRRWSSVGR